MAERAVGFPSHHEYRTVRCGKVDGLALQLWSPGTNSESSLLAERNGNDGGAGHHIVNAVPMAADVMAEAAVIPVQQNTIETRVDDFPRPVDERHQDGWDGQRLWELARVNFPAAILILDLYHALERLHTLCAGLYGADSPWAARMAHTWTAMLKNDQIGEVIAALRRRRNDLGPPPADPLEKQIAYFERHQDKMLYKTYRDHGLFYGSGVVVGGCKSVIGQRRKESGMFWTQAGATSVLNLRLALKGNRWDECWNRLNQSDYLKIKLAA
jgi:hypothetical protein